MYTRNELLKSKTYWVETIQNELYSYLVEYMERENLSQNELAKKLGVTKGYVSQILKGDFNFTLKTIVEISLAIGKAPNIEFEDIEQFIKNDNESELGVRSHKDNSSIIYKNDFKGKSSEWIVYCGNETRIVNPNESFPLVEAM